MSTLNSPEGDLILLDEVFGIIKPRLAYMRGFVQAKMPEGSMSQGIYYLPVVSWRVRDKAGKVICTLEIQLNRREEWRYGFTRTATWGFSVNKDPREVVKGIEDELRDGERIDFAATGSNNPNLSLAFRLANHLAGHLESSLIDKRRDIANDESRLRTVKRLMRQSRRY